MVKKRLAAQKKKRGNTEEDKEGLLGISTMASTI